MNEFDRVFVDIDDRDTFIQQQAVRTSKLAEAVLIEVGLDSGGVVGISRRVSRKLKYAINVLVNSLAYHISQRRLGMGGAGVVLPSADKHTRIRSRFNGRQAHNVPGKNALETAAIYLNQAGLIEVSPGAKGLTQGLAARALIPTTKFAELQRQLGWTNDETGNALEVSELVKINTENGQRRELSSQEQHFQIVKGSLKLVKSINNHNAKFKWLLLNCHHPLIVAPKQTDRYLLPLLGKRVSSEIHLGETQEIQIGDYCYSNLGKPNDNDTAIELAPSKMNYQRIFSGNRFDQCGRFFNALQREVHRCHRHCILVEFQGKTMPLVEIDYSSIHPRIAYAFELKRQGQTKLVLPSDDLYEIGDKQLHRELIKAVFLVLMNLGHDEGPDIVNEKQDSVTIGSLAGAVNKRWKKSRTKAINQYLFKKHYGLEISKDPTKLPVGWSHEDIAACRDRIRSQHWQISSWLESAKGPHLMFIESQITGLVADAMIRANYPFLLIHDAIFTVDQSDACATLRQAMRDAFLQVTGVKLDLNGLSEEKLAPPQELLKQLKGEIK